MLEEQLCRHRLVWKIGQSSHPFCNLVMKPVGAVSTAACKPTSVTCATGRKILRECLHLPLQALTSLSPVRHGRILLHH